MNILILGSGGREHAFAHALSKSDKISKIFVAPGNAGTENIATNIHANPGDFKTIKNIVLEQQIEMLVVGPEAPLVKGIHDFFKEDSELSHVAVIGPNKAGAQLEGSKEFSKEFMKRNNIPTARFQSFTADNIEQGFDFLETLQPPFVLKADGLAAGKGVLILNTLKEAQFELESMLLQSKFGDASSKVVVEEFLPGIELSVFVLTDGKSYKILPSAKDYKRIGEGDTGLNTGGMGAISPVPFADQDFLQKVEQRIVIPTIEGLRKENIDYRGFIFIGLMNVQGDPFVIEYNVRMGDPETEVVLPRIKSDLFDLFEGVASQTLDRKIVEVDSQTAATVVMVSGGYPESYEKGKEILGLKSVTESQVYHAGTKRVEDKILTSGGRVLAVTSLAVSVKEATEKSYRSVDKIHFDKVNFRRDIGADIM